MLDETAYEALTKGLRLVLGYGDIKVDPYHCAVSNTNHGFLTAVVTNQSVNVEYLLLKIQNACRSRNPYVQFINMGLSVTLVGFMEMPFGVKPLKQLHESFVLQRGRFLGVSLDDVLARREAAKIRADQLTIQLFCTCFQKAGSDSTLLHFRFHTASDPGRLRNLLTEVENYGEDRLARLKKELDKRACSSDRGERALSEGPRATPGKSGLGGVAPEAPLGRLGRWAKKFLNPCWVTKRTWETWRPYLLLATFSLLTAILSRLVI